MGGGHNMPPPPVRVLTKSFVWEGRVSTPTDFRQRVPSDSYWPKLPRSQVKGNFGVSWPVVIRSNQTEASATKKKVFQSFKALTFSRILQYARQRTALSYVCRVSFGRSFNVGQIEVFAVVNFDFKVRISYIDDVLQPHTVQPMSKYFSLVILL